MESRPGREPLEEPGRTPGSAEGDRATVEEDLRQKGLHEAGRGPAERRPEGRGGGTDEPGRTPGSAEGDRATVEENLRRRGLSEE